MQIKITQVGLLTRLIQITLPSCWCISASYMQGKFILAPIVYKVDDLYCLSRVFRSPPRFETIPSLTIKAINCECF